MRIPFITVLASWALSAASLAQSTAFTYQGELQQGPNLANGLHDISFKLFDAASGGTQAGSTICVDNVVVTNGKFAVSIDFGQQFATPATRYLEIIVRADVGQPCSDDSGYVTLSPRQQLTATPLASHALHATRANSAFALDAADGSPASAVIVDNTGKVGIGTASPSHSVHIAAAGPTIALQDTNATSQQAGYVSFRDNANLERAWVGYGTAGSPHFSIVNTRSGGDIVLSNLGGGNVRALSLTVAPTGNVGIGTTAPSSALDVRGDIRLGASGQYRAAGGEENLRLVRGTIAANGTVIRGSGFTAQRLDVGKYRVTFTSPFASTPAITAMSTRHSGDLQVGFAALDEFAQPTASQATLVIRVFPAEEYRDSQFDFIAVGPR